MMTWNYRVFREENGDFVVREVFYTEDGLIAGCTANAVEPFGRTLEELAQNLEDFKAALALPVLSLDDIPETSSTDKTYNPAKTISHEELLIELGLTTPQDDSHSRIKSRKKIAP